MPAEPRTLAQDQALLDALADIGVEMARDTRDILKAHQDQAAPLTQAYDRTARAVRRTIMVKHHLPKLIAAPIPDPANTIAAARRTIVRDVEDVIELKAHDDDEAAALQAEFVDRIEAPDIDDDILRRPIADIVAGICRDLGIASHAMNRPGFGPGRRRTPEEVRVLCARAAKTFTGPEPEPTTRPKRPFPRETDPPPPRPSIPTQIRRIPANEPLIDARLREAARRREQAESTDDS